MKEVVFPNVLNEIKDSVSSGLDESHEIMKAVSKNAPGRLSFYMDELVSRKGKRMRATFVFLIAATKKGFSQRRAALVASSIELLHLATLVHDDIIDESERRRHELTAHKKWGAQIAVLVGDYALSKALELIIEDEDRRIPTSISGSSSKLVAGEILEIEHSGKLGLTMEEYYEVIYGKTASLWESCGECGAIIAGFDDELVKETANLGKNMGMAFQIIDDLLDYGFGAEDLGKAKNSDIQNGLTTMPLILFFESCSSEDKAKMEALINGEVGAEDMKEISAMLTQSGSFQKAKDIAFEKIEACFDTIKKFPESKEKGYLKDLCEMLANRSH